MSEGLPLSNVLADLAERVKLAAGASRDAERAAIEKAVEAGVLLCQAKEASAHGEWLRFLERADIHDRQARRLMQLARSGLKSDTVSELGGIKAALEWLKDRRLPKAGEILVADTGDNHAWDLTAVVWPDERQPGTYRIGALDLNPATPHASATIKPVSGGELNVWTVLHHVLDYRFAAMRFTITDENDPRAALVRDAVGLAA